MKLVPIKELDPLADKPVIITEKINEIVRFLNALNISVELIGAPNKIAIGWEHDEDLIKRFGEWFPKDFVR